MASNVRSEEYAQLKAEFDTMQVEMDALGIGASSKKLEEFEDTLASSSSSETKEACGPCSPGQHARNRSCREGSGSGRRFRGGKLKCQCRALGAWPLELPFSTARATHDPFDCAAFRVKDGARPSVASRARDCQLAPGRRQASAALD